MKKTIAVVEDNADDRLLLRAILDDRFAVCECGGGEAALAGLREAAADLGLLDISLPEMDGVQVLSRIRSDDVLKGLPVIALTAHAMAGDREKYLRAGFDDYLTKPIVDEDVLLGAIARRLP